jgi:very-short-patch-repair endonuclease
MKIHVKYNNPKFTRYRKGLRNSSTSAEACLWFYLKQKKLAGRKFTRQKSIGDFIIDFYCPEEKIAIELDGEQHFWEVGIMQDNKKTNFLECLGIVVIRFENKWVFEDIEFVLGEIKKCFKSKNI